MSWRIFAVIALSAVAGCSPEDKHANVNTGSAHIAVVADKSITASLLEQYELALPDYLRSKQEGVAAHRAHVQSLIDKELVLIEAKERGLHRLPAIESKLAEMVDERLVAELTRELIAALPSISDEEQREAFEKHFLGWEIWPAHILSATESDAIEVIRLLAEGNEFSKVARERSIASDAEKGGNLGGYFGPGDAVSVLRQGVFNLEEGQVSEPIETIDGYEVVKVIRKRRIPFYKMRAHIVEQLVRRQAEKRRRALVDSLKAARRLRYYPANLQQVVDALRNSELSPTQAPLIEFDGGALTVGEAVRRLHAADRGAVPADTAAVRWALEQKVVPDVLLALEARDQGRHERGDMVAWIEKKRQGLMASQLRIDEVKGKVVVSEQEVRAYYEKYLDTYRSLPGIIQMTEVLSQTRADADSILARAKAGERLEELAVRHSLRPTMDPVGGHAFSDSGRVVIESLVQSPYRTFFGDSNHEDVGILQGPLEVQDRFSVFRLDEPFEKEPISFRQKRRPIRVNIRQAREAQIFEAFLDSLRHAHDDQVRIDEAALARYATAH